jgi:hypothetical protein
MKEMYKLLFGFIICVLTGIAIGYFYLTYQPTLAQWFLFKPSLYNTSNSSLQTKFEALSAVSVEWSQLLPDSEKRVLKKYQQTQASTPTEFADNILLSLTASVDKDYTTALISTNSVGTFDEQAVSISGFIVPIDYAEDRSLENIFIVPYFGACLHFPPPPPNQIIFAQLSGGFIDFELTQAYRLRGILRRGLFEDPLGTSAYILDLVAIEPYYDNPDNFRQH